MARSSESILEDILSRLEAQGNGVQRITAEEIARAISMVDVNRRKTKKSEGPGILSGSAKAAADTAGGLMQSKNAADAAGVLATGFRGITTSILPGFGTAIGLAADAASKFYEYMNENLQMYQQLNTSGMQTTNGMMGLQRALSTGRLSLDEFLSATSSVRDVMASMGSDGPQQFGNLLNEVMKTEDSMGSLNMTNEQMGKYLAANLKMQKAYGAFDKMDRNEMTQYNRNYMDSLNKYSKTLGISTDELANKLQESSDKVTGFGTQLALSENGMDPEAAANTANTLNAVMGSFGGFGDAVNDQMARFIAVGDFDLDTDLGKLYQSSDEIRNLFDKTRDMALSGQLATEDGAKKLQDMMSNGGIVESIDNNLTMMRGAFGDATANQMIQWRNQTNNYNADIAKVNDFWGNTMKSFNRLIEDIFFGFKSGVADLFIDPQAFIKNMFGDKWGSWLLDGAFNWEIPDTPLVGSLKDFLTTFFEPVSWFWDALQGYGSGVSDRFGSIKQPSWENIVRALMPDWLADIVLENGDQMNDTSIAGASDIGDRILKAHSEYRDAIAEQLSNAARDLSKLDIEVSKSAAEAFESMYTSIGDWWNKPSTQTVITKTITQNPKAIQTPVSVIAPDASSTNSQLSNELISVLRGVKGDETTQSLLTEITKLNATNEQQVILLKKQISANSMLRVN